MNDDKELLELAAKAAGIEYRWPAAVDQYSKVACIPWNPLTDDGDALRLAVNLGIDGLFCVNFGCGVVSTEIPSNKSILLACEDMEKQDPYAATRRAIVRAAAEIGKGMK